MPKFHCWKYGVRKLMSYGAQPGAPSSGLPRMVVIGAGAVAELFALTALKNGAARLCNVSALNEALLKKTPYPPRKTVHWAPNRSNAKPTRGAKLFKSLLASDRSNPASSEVTIGSGASCC